MKANSVMLLATEDGRQVSAEMLSDRYDEAYKKAAMKAMKAGNKKFARVFNGHAAQSGVRYGDL